MFEKLKVRATKVKKWVKKNEAEIAYFVGGTVGILATTIAYVVIDKKNSELVQEQYYDELKVISMRDTSDGMYSGSGAKGPTVSGLSEDLIRSGAPEDAVITGALIYTKIK